ncbi:MAG: ABC transporter ATP-binding protein [Halanaerobiales bacterium]
MSQNLLEVEGLKTYFYNEQGIVYAVDDVSFNIQESETLGVVGESGCGKSITSLSIMNLVPQPRGSIEGGSIKYYGLDGQGKEITSLKSNSKEMRKIRGNEIAMIFQEPMTSLTPVYTIGEQIMEAILLHQNVNKQEARKRTIEMLDNVGIAAPEQRVDEYPHQLSGGMRQRAMIGMALSCNPSLLIADEPTTALDVTIESQILDLMKELQDEFEMSIMFITHDLGVIGEVTDRVIVMYMGKVVERATTDDLFYNPKHPYTKALLNSIPKIGVKEKLDTIPGSVPSPYNLPEGCYFAPRCPESMPVCEKKQPPIFETESGQEVKCWLYK